MTVFAAQTRSCRQKNLRIVNFAANFLSKNIVLTNFNMLSYEIQLFISNAIFLTNFWIGQQTILILLVKGRLNFLRCSIAVNASSINTM